MANRAAAILAFSYDPQHPLEGVIEELKSLKTIIGQKAALQVDDFWKPTAQEVQDALGKYSNPDIGDAVHIFHFSGHASPKEQQWNDEAGQDAVSVNAERLAEYMGLHCDAMKLVFLNGCSTEKQAKYFIENKVQAVIATTQKVGDIVATKFAIAFYREFTNLNAKRSLRTAFDSAWTSINFTEELIKRDLDDSLPGTDVKKSIYELHINPNFKEVEHATFDLWQKVPDRGNKVTIVEDRNKLQDKGVHETAYLKCNRDDQRDAMSRILQQKIKNELPAPCFVAIHDEEKHCPEFVALWLEQYGIREALKAQNAGQPENAEQFKTICKTLEPLSPRLFSKSDWNDPTNDERELYKEKLFDLFGGLFGTAPDKSKQLQTFPKENYPIIVVQQRIDFERWGASTQNMNNFALLMDYYRGAFCEKILQPFSSRLIILLQCSYVNDHKDPKFEQYFKESYEQRTANAHSHFDRIFGFEFLYKSDLDDWRDVQLKEHFFESSAILAKENPLSMFTAQKELTNIIREFNRQYGE